MDPHITYPYNRNRDPYAGKLRPCKLHTGMCRVCEYPEEAKGMKVLDKFRVAGMEYHVCDDGYVRVCDPGTEEYDEWFEVAGRDLSDLLEQIQHRVEVIPAENGG